MSGFERWVVARRRRWLAAWAVAALALAPGLARLGVDNSPRVFFLERSHEVARYRAFVERFGPEEGVRFVVAGDALWTRAGLDYLERVEGEAAALPGVRHAAGPITHHRRFLAEPPGADPAAFRARLLANRLDRELGFVAGDGGAATLLLETEELAPADARRLLAALDRLAAEAPAGVTAFALGRRSLELALDASVGEIERVYFPLLAALAVALLAAAFREASAVALPLLYVGVCELTLLGAMGFAGVRLNLILAVLPPLLFVIGLATAIFLLIRCRALEAEGLDARAATVATLVEQRRALAGTTLTTAVGFGALAVSPVAPIAAFGVWAGLGMLIQLAAAFTLLPALLATVAAHRGALPERGLEVRLERFGRRLGESAARRRGAVLTLFAALALVALAGLPRLRAESNALTYLPVGHPVPARTVALEALGVGSATVELWLQAPPEGPGLDAPAALGRLGDLARELGRRPPALSAVSAGDLVDDLGALSPLAGLPEAARRAALLPLVRADEAGGKALARFLSPDGRDARLTVFLPTVGFEALDPWRRAALAAAHARFPGLRVEATGGYPLLLAIQRHLLSTLVGSLALTLAFVVLAFVVLLREWADVLRALVPNLWPIAAVFGGMGWFGVPLDLATVMVASIVLGLAVDTTIRTLARHRERRRQVGAREAVLETLESAAPAYLLTAAILCAGFAVCGLSAFAPTARFGLLAAAALALSLATNLVLVPALFAGAAQPGGAVPAAARIG
jgi:predicted RND superfamily exporter protein